MLDKPRGAGQTTPRSIGFETKPLTDGAPETPEKPALTDASTNPWYVLMTVAGEQDCNHIDWDRHARNRRYFNGWMAQSLSEDAKQKLIADSRATPEDLADLTPEETGTIAQAFAERCPDSDQIHANEPNVDLSNTSFTSNLICSGVVLPNLGCRVMWHEARRS